ncbi:hypothetical protein JB92DRAFT_1218020 [Gautieria morchelliformis]|nr:hypothetical protein JB92DRAFT_1218020 [Gautieria morchelliformis]
MSVFRALHWMAAPVPVASPPGSAAPASDAICRGTCTVRHTDASEGGYSNLFQTHVQAHMRHYYYSPIWYERNDVILRCCRPALCGVAGENGLLSTSMIIDVTSVNIFECFTRLSETLRTRIYCSNGPMKRLRWQRSPSSAS